MLFLCQATCCEDKLHCCPQGSKCDVEHSTCIFESSGAALPWEMFGRRRAKTIVWRASSVAAQFFKTSAACESFKRVQYSYSDNAWITLVAGDCCNIHLIILKTFWWWIICWQGKVWLLLFCSRWSYESLIFHSYLKWDCNCSCNCCDCNQWFSDFSRETINACCLFLAYMF